MRPPTSTRGMHCIDPIKCEGRGTYFDLECRFQLQREVVGPRRTRVQVCVPPHDHTLPLTRVSILKTRALCRSTTSRRRSYPVHLLVHNYFRGRAARVHRLEVRIDGVSLYYPPRRVSPVTLDSARLKAILFVLLRTFDFDIDPALVVKSRSP